MLKTQRLSAKIKVMAPRKRLILSNIFSERWQKNSMVAWSYVCCFGMIFGHFLRPILAPFHPRGSLEPLLGHSRTLRGGLGTPRGALETLLVDFWSISAQLLIDFAPFFGIVLAWFGSFPPTLKASKPPPSFLNGAGGMREAFEFFVCLTISGDFWWVFMISGCFLLFLIIFWKWCLLIF